MDSIAVVSVNIPVNGTEMLFGTDSESRSIRTALSEGISNGQKIHILANDSETMDLYVQISYMIREILPESGITLVTDNMAFLNYADSFNHLCEDDKVIRLDDNIEHRERIFDEYALLDDFSDYPLLRDSISSGRYERTQVLIPTLNELEQSMVDYLWECGSKSYPPDKTGGDLIRYIGLDYKNLRSLITLEKKFEALSDQEYDWNQLFGRNADLDLWQYLKSADNEMRSRFEQLRESIYRRAISAIETALKESQNISSMLSILDCNQSESLYAMLSKEIQDDTDYLKDVNKQTFQDLQRKEEQTRTEKPGILGKRRECLDDLLETADFFLNQRYEICRSVTVKTIYAALQEWLRDHDVLRPKGQCDQWLCDAFDSLDLSDSFRNYLIQAFCMREFFTTDRLTAVREQLVRQAKGNDSDALMIELRNGKTTKYLHNNVQIIPQTHFSAFLKNSSEKSVRIITEGIGLQCVMIEKDRVVLRMFPEIQTISMDNAAIADILKELKTLETDSLVPVTEKEYRIEQGMWQSLVYDDSFVAELTESIGRMRKIRSYRDELTKLL